jgi:hypothetical protein
VGPDIGIKLEGNIKKGNKTLMSPDSIFAYISIGIVGWGFSALLGWRYGSSG